MKGAWQANADLFFCRSGLAGAPDRSKGVRSAPGDFAVLHKSWGRYAALSRPVRRPGKAAPTGTV